MRKVLVLVASLLAVATTFCANNRSAEAGVIPAFSAPIDLGGASELLIKIKKKKKHTDDDNNTTPNGEHACPAGYVVLDKPNKYGAFCEPKEGLPDRPKRRSCASSPARWGTIAIARLGLSSGASRDASKRSLQLIAASKLPVPEAMAR